MLVSLRAWPGFGEWPTWSGGTIVWERPLLCVVDQEGGGDNRSDFLGVSFCSQLFRFCDNLAAERIRKEVLLYIYIYFFSKCVGH